MSTTIIFDTETDRLIPKHTVYTQVDVMPHIVQLAALLIDKDFNILVDVDLIIRPDGWEIPQSASDIHGITNSVAIDRGIPLIDAMRVFHSLAKTSDTWVCHNMDYDGNVVNAEYVRIGQEASIEVLRPKRKECTMKAATQICNLPGRFPGSPKWPKLEEAHRILLGKEMEGAHNARYDVRATLAIYRHLKSIGRM